MDRSSRNRRGFVTASIVGLLGGLIGLGGAEFRLPVLIGGFGLPTLAAVIFNKATSLVVVAAALPLRGATISPGLLWSHIEVAAHLLAGSLLGAWWAADHAVRLSRRWLDRIVFALLASLSLLLLFEAVVGLHPSGVALIASAPLRFVVGATAGFAIGVVAAILGVAGGELLIPTIVLLCGVDIKLAGSLSLLVSLPTMVVGFARYSRAGAFVVLKEEWPLFRSMALGSILGAGIGALLLGSVPTRALMALLGLLLLVAAVKTFRGAH